MAGHNKMNNQTIPIVWNEAGIGPVLSNIVIAGGHVPSTLGLSGT